MSSFMFIFWPFISIILSPAWIPAVCAEKPSTTLSTSFDKYVPDVDIKIK